MFRQKNCIVYGMNSKGGVKKFYLEGYAPVNNCTNTLFTDDLDRALLLPYDVAKSVATREGLYVESRY